MNEREGRLDTKTTPAAAAERSQEQPRRLVLENDQLQVTFLPDHGGKIVSLISKRTGAEWLLPPLRPHTEAVANAGFEAWDGGGFDECLPTVAPSGNAPDHGEVWRHAWQEDVTEDAVALQTTALAGALRFERHAHLDGASLLLRYSVTNQSGGDQSLLYSAHPLLRVEEGDRILLPKEVESVCVEGSQDERLGAQGERVGWPRAAQGEDLSILGPPDGKQADKLFAGPLASGWCGLYRPSLGEGVEIAFDANVLPYLGVWICRAAWPDAGIVKQYSVAFEPTNANCDALADAERNGTAWRLKPAEQREWTLRFQLSSNQLSASQLTAKMNEVEEGL